MGVYASRTTIVESITGSNTASFATKTYDSVLLFVDAEYTAGATAGNRQVRLELLDDANAVVGRWFVGSNITANQARTLGFVPGVGRETSFDSQGFIITGYPTNLTVPAGYTLRLRDSANISAQDTITAVAQLRPLLK